MGGTFDHLHEGHKFLIKTALSISQNIVIGLTTDKLLKNKKFASKIQDYQTRENNLIEFIKNFTEISRVKIIPLSDPYGPPINDPKYEGLVISQETIVNATKINEIRERKGFKPLILIVIPILKNKKGEVISSTKIREKLI
ncbi:MAG: pantetheine-phosphate adenylyltransferase [Promethearchaeota archaeon]